MEIFLPDNFSISEIKYRDISPDDRTPFEAIMKKYLRKFVLKKVLKLDRNEINSQNYQLIVNIGGKKKRFLLRKYRLLSDTSQIGFYLSLLKKFKDMGLPVSRLVEAGGGKLFVKMSDGFYCLFDFIEAGHFVPSKKGYEAIVRTIAKMHLIFNHVGNRQTTKKIGTLSRRNKAYYNVIKHYSAKDFTAMKKLIESKPQKSEVDSEILNSMPVFLQKVKEIKKHNKEMRALPRQIIHSDLHPHNILMRGQNLKAIIDFDALRLSEQARDVANAIHRFGRQFIVRNPSADRKEKCRRLTDQFIKIYNSVKPISDKEKKLMPLLVLDDFLRKILFVLKGVYLEKNTAWESNLPKFLMAIEELDYFWPARKK